MSHSVTSGPQPGPAAEGQPAGAPAVQRQYVNFAFFKLDPA